MIEGVQYYLLSYLIYFSQAIVVSITNPTGDRRNTSIRSSEYFYNIRLKESG